LQIFHTPEHTQHGPQISKPGHDRNRWTRLFGISI
jgi:hypothetical protein